MKLFKTIDEKFEEIGFIKENENAFGVVYIRKDKDFEYTQKLCLLNKSNGKHLIQSYDPDLYDNEGIGNTCVGLTAYEAKLCIKKMKQLNREWRNK